jgi:hypothetical protein
MPQKFKVAVERISLVFHIRQAPVSNLDLDIDYTDMSLVILLGISRETM